MRGVRVRVVVADHVLLARCGRRRPASRPDTRRGTCSVIRSLTRRNGEVEAGNSALVGGAEYKPDVHFTERGISTGDVLAGQHERGYVEEGRAAIRIEMQRGLKAAVCTEYGRGVPRDGLLQRAGKPG